MLQEKSNNNRYCNRTLNIFKPHLPTFLSPQAKNSYQPVGALIKPQVPALASSCPTLLLAEAWSNGLSPRLLNLQRNHVGKVQRHFQPIKNKETKTFRKTKQKGPGPSSCQESSWNEWDFLMLKSQDTKCMAQKKIKFQTMEMFADGPWKLHSRFQTVKKIMASAVKSPNNWVVYSHSKSFNLSLITLLKKIFLQNCHQFKPL